MAVLLILLYILAVTPLRVFWAVEKPGKGGRAVLRVWGVPLRIEKLPKIKQPAGFRTALPALRGSIPGLRVLFRGITVRRLDMEIRVGGPDAAGVAVLTGLIRGVFGLWPAARVRCVPAWGEKTALRGECILEARLGILWTAALRGLMSRGRPGKREETA